MLLTFKRIEGDAIAISKMRMVLTSVKCQKSCRTKTDCSATSGQILLTQKAEKSMDGSIARDPSRITMDCHECYKTLASSDKSCKQIIEFNLNAHSRSKQTSKRFLVNVLKIRLHLLIVNVYMQLFFFLSIIENKRRKGETEHEAEARAKGHL